MNKKWVVFLGVLLVATFGCAAAFWPFGNGKALKFPGIVEVQEVRLGSKVGGRVEAVLVKEGQETYKNQPLIVFEAPELRNQKQQLQARRAAAEAEWMRTLNGPRWEEKNAAAAAVAAAKAKYVRVENGWREEEQRQATSDLQTAKADYDQALKEYNRIAGLFRQMAASRLEYESALAVRDRTHGRFSSAQAKFDMIVTHGSRQEDKDEAKAEWKRAEAKFLELANGSRWEDIALAKAKVDELRAQIDAVDINLAETTVIVPPNLGKALVEVVAVRPGDLVPPNQPVVRVLRVEDLWVKIFVPETQYGLVTDGKKVTLTIDSHPGRVFHGVVEQRANISEFTPRNVQSLDERRHQVFGVKIRVEDAQGIFNAGMAAEVTIPLN